MYLMHAFIDFGIAFASFSLDGVWVLCVGLGALRPDFTVLDFGIAFSGFPWKESAFWVLGFGPVGLSATFYSACFWHSVVKLFLGRSQRFGCCALVSWALWRDFIGFWHSVFTSCLEWSQRFGCWALARGSVGQIRWCLILA